MIRVILIEDNPADVFLIKEALRQHGVAFELTWISDGEEALRRLNAVATRNDPPDLILLDLNLPKVDGKELLGEIRRRSEYARTPVAVLTSSDSPLDRRETSALGANCYIKKPPTLDEFLAVGATIKQMLSPEASPALD